MIGGKTKIKGIRVKLSGSKRVSLFLNLTAVVRAKVGRTSGRDAMEVFRYCCLLMIFSVVNLEREKIDCIGRKC